MMSTNGTTDDRVLEKIEKLLRLAAPTSNTTEHERASAAIEAAKLIEEHDISLSVEKRKRNGKERTVNGERVTPHAWVLNIAPYHVGCAYCGKLISPRDVVWVKVIRPGEIQYRHNCSPCRII